MTLLTMLAIMDMSVSKNLHRKTIEKWTASLVERYAELAKIVCCESNHGEHQCDIRALEVLRWFHRSIGIDVSDELITQAFKLADEEVVRARG